ncbi:MAG: helix-turn-helix transcriptional regulator [Rhodocyclaceae bacterium]|nr:helix-turn-helix transcriptional regulator [Rhodocyclaceae bacterium]
MEEQQVVKALAALAQTHRLRVFRALVVAGEQGLTPGVMATDLDLAGATLSFHLKELMHAGLVTQDRQGRNLVYRADYASMTGLLAYLTTNCCQGQACLDKSATSCGC